MLCRQDIGSIGVAFGHHQHRLCFFSDPGYAANGSIISHTRNTVCVGLGLISYNIITYIFGIINYNYIIFISIYLYIYICGIRILTNHKWGFTWIYPYVRNQYHSSHGDVYPEGASWRLMNCDIKIKEYMEILNHPR